MFCGVGDLLLRSWGWLFRELASRQFMGMRLRVLLLWCGCLALSDEAHLPSIDSRTEPAVVAGKTACWACSLNT